MKTSVQTLALVLCLLLVLGVPAALILNVAVADPGCAFTYKIKKGCPLAPVQPECEGIGDKNQCTTGVYKFLDYFDCAEDKTQTYWYTCEDDKLVTCYEVWSCTYTGTQCKANALSSTITHWKKVDTSCAEPE